MGSKDEQEWFRSFYEGTFLIKGWKSRTKELLQAVPDADSEGMSDLLANLGEKIGREWAKDNRVRRINTAMIRQWGQDLRIAKQKGPDVLGEEIRRLDAEVDNILS